MKALLLSTERDDIAGIAYTDFPVGESLRSYLYAMTLLNSKM